MRPEEIRCHRSLHISKAIEQQVMASGKDLVLVVDEAHNLPTRLRDMLSSYLDTNALDKASKEAKNVADQKVGELKNEAIQLQQHVITIREQLAPMQEKSSLETARIKALEELLANQQKHIQNQHDIIDALKQEVFKLNEQLATNTLKTTEVAVELFAKNEELQRALDETKKELETNQHTMNVDQLASLIERWGIPSFSWGIDQDRSSFLICNRGFLALKLSRETNRFTQDAEHLPESTFRQANEAETRLSKWLTQSRTAGDPLSYVRNNLSYFNDIFQETLDAMPFNNPNYQDVMNRIQTGNFQEGDLEIIRDTIKTTIQKLVKKLSKHPTLMAELKIMVRYCRIKNISNSNEAKSYKSLLDQFKTILSKLSVDSYTNVVTYIPKGVDHVVEINRPSRRVKK
jgi:hypothetical protein